MSEGFGLCKQIMCESDLRNDETRPLYTIKPFLCSFASMSLCIWPHFPRLTFSTGLEPQLLRAQANIFPLLLSERDVLWPTVPVKDGLWLVQFGVTAGHRGYSLSSQGIEVLWLAQPEKGSALLLEAKANTRKPVCPVVQMLLSPTVLDLLMPLKGLLHVHFTWPLVETCIKKKKQAAREPR